MAPGWAPTALSRQSTAGSRTETSRRGRSSLAAATPACQREPWTSWRAAWITNPGESLWKRNPNTLALLSLIMSHSHSHVRLEWLKWWNKTSSFGLVWFPLWGSVCHQMEEGMKVGMRRLGHFVTKARYLHVFLKLELKLKQFSKHACYLMVTV